MPIPRLTWLAISRSSFAPAINIGRNRPAPPLTALARHRPPALPCFPMNMSPLRTRQWTKWCSPLMVTRQSELTRALRLLVESLNSLRNLLGAGTQRPVTVLRKSLPAGIQSAQLHRRRNATQGLSGTTSVAVEPSKTLSVPYKCRNLQNGSLEPTMSSSLGARPRPWQAETKAPRKVLLTTQDALPSPIDVLTTCKGVPLPIFILLVEVPLKLSMAVLVRALATCNGTQFTAIKHLRLLVIVRRKVLPSLIMRARSCTTLPKWPPTIPVLSILLTSLFARTSQIIVRSVLVESRPNC